MGKEIYNWTKHNVSPRQVRPANLSVQIDNETFRDGLQGTQVACHPEIEQIFVYLDELAARRYSEHLDIGFPASGPRHRDQIVTLVNYASDQGHDLTFSVAGRGAAVDDVKAILEVSEKVGQPLEADLFLDASTLRARVEGWDRDTKLGQLRKNIELVKAHGNPVMFVPERASETSPEELFQACKIAADSGVDRIAIADTNGVLNPIGTTNIFRAIFDEVGSKYPEVKFDFHEHEDLGMGRANCVVAATEGVDRLHATSRGIGERAGNVDLEKLLVVLALNGLRDVDMSQIQKFTQMAADIFSVPIQSHESIVGPESTATASGVHASGYAKDRSIYSPYPNGPEDVGLTRRTSIGPLSSLSNVYAFCEQWGIESPTEERAREILDLAKDRWGLLSKDDVKSVLGRNGHS